MGGIYTMELIILNLKLSPTQKINICLAYIPSKYNPIIIFYLVGIRGENFDIPDLAEIGWYGIQNTPLA